ncbi:phosphomannomutase/phosphoglucomutase [Candidatus Pacearchaeota archaeon]|nr:phosphomannomutase/phosphoglucomutase [Candidatus Pacearchaeota archaeon]
MPIPQTIFRAYDIRGTYPDQLNTENAKLIGKGFATWLIQKTGNPGPAIVVGRDNRTHGEELQKAFIEGLMECGCGVTDLGLSPSPYLYFANCYGEFDAGCNVTASHNPAHYNGFKLMTKNAHAVFGDMLQEVYQVIEKGEFAAGEGAMLHANLMDDYFKKLKSIFSYSRPLKIVVDTANGVAGMLYPTFLRKLGHHVEELYTELDGTFPNHEPDPIVEANLEDLKKKVLETQSDFGISFDGDGDRCGIVTEKGEFIDADKTLMLLTKDVLSRHPGGSLVYTVSNSQVLFDLTEEWGGKPYMCKVGHSYVEDAMNEHKAILGGEQSGHFFLPENYYPYDDALVTACRLIKIASDSDGKVSELFEEFPKTFAEPEIRPKCPDDVKFDIIQRVTDHFKDDYPAETMDGIRLDFGNGGWAGIRASNTSPRISITMEAKSQEELDQIKSAVLDHLKSYSEIQF